MPVPADEVEDDDYLRMLVIGPPKSGKTECVIPTSPRPRRLLLCESGAAIRGAKRQSTDFEVELIRPDNGGHIWQTMLKAIVLAKKDAKDGKLKTLIVDPLNVFARRLLLEMEQQFVTAQGNVDGRKAHPAFSDRMFHAIDLLLTVPCHVIVVSHFMDVGGEDSGDKPKTGPGIVPLMPNMRTRTELAAMFYDVVWFDIAPKDAKDHYRDRIFIAGPEGVWGAACRSLKRNNVVLPAHIGKFIDRAAAEAAGTVPDDPPVRVGPPKPLRPLQGGRP